MEDDVTNAAPPVRFLYRNWRGLITIRKLYPKGIRFDSTEYHPEPQWLLDGYDLDKRADRSYALKGVLIWDVDGAVFPEKLFGALDRWRKDPLPERAVELAEAIDEFELDKSVFRFALKLEDRDDG